jgi:hypothetical protein
MTLNNFYHKISRRGAIARPVLAGSIQQHVGVALFFLMTLLSVRAQDAADKSSGPVGRYQFVVANVTTGEGKMETLFKIDTVTGAAWRFVSSGAFIPENKRFDPQVKSYTAEGWHPIADSFDAEMKKAFDEINKMPARTSTPYQSKKP